MINITKPIILRGSGPSQTTLYFPLALADVYGNTPDSTSGYSPWAFRPGFLNFLGSDPIGLETLLGHATQAAPKGSRQLTLAGWVSGRPPHSGTWVRLAQSDPAPTDTTHSKGSQGPSSLTLQGTDALGSVPLEETPSSDAKPRSLIEHLHGGWNVMSPDAAPHVYAGELQGTQHAAQLLARVVAATDKTLTLDRALPFDLDPRWQPEIHNVTASLKETGIEDLTIEFAEKAYGGHFNEAGYNALYFSAVHDSWARNVDIVNTDYAIGMNGTHFSTLEGIRLYDRNPRGGGHHGIDISYGADNLVTNFTIGKEFLHDLSIEWFTHGNVFSDGSGVDLNLDHHRGAAFRNLFTNLHMGKGSRPFASSGAHGRGPHSGAFNTYWNLFSDTCLSVPDADFGHSLLFAGARSAEPCSSAQKQLFSSLLHPRNLHDAMQIRHRLFTNSSMQADTERVIAKL